MADQAGEAQATIAYVLVIGDVGLFLAGPFVSEAVAGEWGETHRFPGRQDDLRWRALGMEDVDAPVRVSDRRTVAVLSEIVITQTRTCSVYPPMHGFSAA